MGNGNKGPVTVRNPVRIDFAGGWSDVHYFSAREGGAVLNAAISPYVEGSARWEGWQLHLEYSLALPPGSHLGTSASVDVAWLAFTNGLIGREPSPVDLAQAAYHLEKLLGVTGGKQDQYAAALGGFNLLRFGAEDEPVDVEQLAVPPQTVRAIEERCVLCYSGKSPGAGSPHEQVWERYRGGDEEIAAALREIRDSATPARDALLRGDLDALAGLLTVNCEAARRLHPGTVSPRMEELFAAGVRAGALGAKACGEGGGGCLLFLCAEGSKHAVEHALCARGGEVIAFEFASPWPYGGTACPEHACRLPSS
jgi:D-glycero-alpha-D-manno-heptose-7-phosphate kinase